MGKTYIVAIFCPKCKTYAKIVGRGAYDDCPVCKGERIGKMVEKWSENDPNIKEEVTNICYGENPRYSVTLGVAENQIEQARKLHPQTEWKRFGNSFRPLIKTRTDKLRMMKQAGYEEYPPDMFKGRQR